MASSQPPLHTATFTNAEAPIPQHFEPRPASPSSPPESRLPSRSNGAAQSLGGHQASVPRATPVASGSGVKVEELDEMEGFVDLYAPVGANRGDEEDEGDEDEDDDVDELKESDGEDDDGSALGFDPFFDPANLFPARQHGSMTIKELFRLVQLGTINLSPEYQRDVVWSDTLREGLIDTLMKGLHIPELVFSVVDDREIKIREDEEASPRRIWNVTDGKQRISTICAFVRGEVLPLDDSRTRYSYRPAPIGKRARVLSQVARERFGAIQVHYASYADLTDPQERELFKRIQQGMILGASEKLHSVAGVFGDWASELASRFCDKSRADSLVPRISNLKRKKEFTAMARIALLLIEGTGGAKYRDDSTLPPIIATRALPGRQRQAEILTVLDRFHRLTLIRPVEGSTADFSPAQKRKMAPGTVYPHQAFRATGRTVSPVEFPFLPLLVETHSALGDGQLLETIELLLAHMLLTYPKEIKMKSDVFKGILKWVCEFDPSSLTDKYNDDGSLRPPLTPSPALEAPLLAPAHHAALYQPSPAPRGDSAPPLAAPVLRPPVTPSFGLSPTGSRRGTVILTPQPEAGPSGLRRSISPSSEMGSSSGAEGAEPQLGEKRERPEDVNDGAAKKKRKEEKALRKLLREAKREKKKERRAREAAREAAERSAETGPVASTSGSQSAPTSVSFAFAGAAPTPPAHSVPTPQPQRPLGFAQVYQPQWGAPAAPRRELFTAGAPAAVATIVKEPSPTLAPAFEEHKLAFEEAKPVEAAAFKAEDQQPSSIWGDAIYID